VPGGRAFSQEVDLDNNIAMLLAIIPAVLIVMAVVIARNAGPQETADRRFLFLLEFITLGILIFLTAIPFLPSDTQQPLFWVSSLFIPVLFGLVVLILANLPKIQQLQKRERILIFLLSLVNAGIIAYHLQKAGFSVLLEVSPPVIITLFVAWSIRKRSSRWIWLLPGVVFLLWWLYNNWRSALLANLPQPLPSILGIAMYLAPVLTVATISLFVHTSIGMVRSKPSNEDSEARISRRTRIEGVLRLLMASIMLVSITNSVYWASIWDQTSDGLSGLMILYVAVIVAIACGMVISLRAVGWSRLVGIVFAVIVGIAVLAGFQAGWGANFKTMTEQRAAQIAQALDRFHTREDRYPQNLTELIPRDLLYVPRPVMFQSEGWCYQGTASKYILTAFFHEYFGTPVSLKEYASAGSTAGELLPCQERLVEMQSKYDWTNSPTTRVMEPTPTPSAAQREQMKTPIAYDSLTPVFVSQESFLPYRWSPDGKWWFFRVIEPGEKQVRMYFFDAASAKICSVEQIFAYHSFSDGYPSAWLSDDRLLYLDGSETPAIFTPCQAGVQKLKVPSGVVLTQVAAADPVSGRILMQSAEAYWLLQPGSEEVQSIPGVQPTSYEAHWDHAAWNPAGSSLAISHLNSRETRDGITLYLIDANTAQVTYSQKMDLASAQSAPYIEWVSNEEILINGPNMLNLLDFHSSPPRQIDVMKELFNLELNFPDQISSNASIPSRDGSGYHLAVWANHPHNQDLYLYHSENGQISVYQPKGEAVLIFPDGQWTPMTRIEGAGQAQDILSLYWVDSARVPVEIRINGHQPRGYPLLDVRYLAGTSQLLLDSSNGVSLISVPDGKLLHFWQTGSGGSNAPYLTVSPDGKTALSIAEGEGIFQIPLEK
jgi:hypothetical protein